VSWLNGYCIEVVGVVYIDVVDFGAVEIIGAVIKFAFEEYIVPLETVR
jgi:hypothetical protein